MLTQKTICQFTTHDPSRHHHICQQKIHRTVSVFPDFEGMSSGDRFQNVITLDLEHLNHHLAQGILVFGYQNRLMPITQGNINHLIYFLSHMVTRREIAFESGSVVQLALYLQPPIVLPNNAKDSGQAQASTFAGSFGGKKWLKDSVKNLGSAFCTIAKASCPW